MNEFKCVFLEFKEEINGYKMKKIVELIIN